MTQAIVEQRSGADAYTKILSSVVKQSHWVIGGKIVFLFASLGTNVLLAKILGPASLGRYLLGLSVIDIVSVFSVAGFDKGMVRFIAILEMSKSGESRNLFIKNGIFVFSASVVLAAVLYQFSPILANGVFHSPEMVSVLRTVCFLLPFVALLRFFDGTLVGLKRADLTSNVSNILIPTSFLLMLCLIYLGSGSIYDCIEARIAVYALVCLGVTSYLLKNLRKDTVRNALQQVSSGRFLAFSTPLMFTGLIYVLLAKMDLVMVAYFVAEEQVGIFAVGVRVAMLIIVGVDVLVPIIRPYLSELSEGGDFATIEALIKPLTKWLIFSGLAIFGIISILRLEILSIFGTGFQSGGTVLVLLGIGYLGNVLSGPNGQLLVMSGKQKWEVANTIVLVSLNFALNVTLIPRMGINGAAIATALSTILVNLVRLVEVYALWGIHPYSWKCLKSIGAVAVGCLASYVTRVAAVSAGLDPASIVVITVGVFFAVLFPCVWFLGVDPEDRILVGFLPAKR